MGEMRKLGPRGSTRVENWAQTHDTSAGVTYLQTHSHSVQYSEKKQDLDKAVLLAPKQMGFFYCMTGVGCHSLLFYTS